MNSIFFFFWIQRMRKFHWFIFGYKSYFPLLGSLICGLAANEYIYVPIMSYLYAMYVLNWKLNAIFRSTYDAYRLVRWVHFPRISYLAHSTISINAECLIRFRNFWFDWKIKDKLKFCAVLIQFSIDFWLKRI